MNALPMICVAYAFVSLGFCLGYVACAVLSRNAIRDAIRDAEPAPATGFREGARRSNVKPTFPKPPPPPAPPPPRDVRGRR